MPNLCSNRSYQQWRQKSFRHFLSDLTKGLLSVRNTPLESWCNLGPNEIDLDILMLTILDQSLKIRKNEWIYTANIFTVENTDVCLCSKSKYNHELYLQSFVCGAAVLASICL